MTALNNRTKTLLFLIIYFLILVSIPISAYALKGSLIKKAPGVVPQAPAPIVVFSTAEQTPTPIPTPVVTSSPTPSPTKAPGKTTAKKTAQPSGPRVPGIPVRIQIPKIGMNAAVEQVGLGGDGSVNVPSSWWTVGWYNLGYKVGDAGSAVMSGHYDTNTGAAAVFFRVGSLSPGDIITVTNGNGSVLKFKVYKKEAYPWDQMPLSTIFGSAGRVQLNLITCSGTWDRTTKNYSHRTVVYSELTI